MASSLRSLVTTALTILVASLAGAAPGGLPPAGATAPVAAGPEPPSEVAPAPGFGWPLVPAPAVSRAFQPPSHPYGPGHRGADLVGTAGQPVLAAGDGVVVYAAPLADRGVVSIDHAGGLRSSYEPVAATVRAGQLVHRGQPVGSLVAGHPGCPAPACLHWGLRHEGAYLDPLLLVRRGQVRLLPWPPDIGGGAG